MAELPETFPVTSPIISPENVASPVNVTFPLKLPDKAPLFIVGDVKVLLVNVWVESIVAKVPLASGKVNVRNDVKLSGALKRIY